MTVTETAAPALDMDKLMGFVFTAVNEVGATLNAALVVMGDKLGYYRALAQGGPMTPAQLAARTQTGEPYAREWLNAQAAGSYLTYDPASGTYTLPPEHAVALTDPESPAYLPGFFQLALGVVHDTQHIVDAARDGVGFGWDEHDSEVHIGCERFFRPSYNANLLTSWCRPWMAWRASCARVPRSPMSAAATVPRQCCSPRLFRPSPSPVLTTTPSRWRPRRLGRRRPGSATGRTSRWPPARPSRAPATSWSDVRLPARHGRSGGGGPPGAPGARRRRHLDDRGTARRRPAWRTT